MTEREFATEVVARLQQSGHRAVWAGGCVRDELLGLTPADYDVATDALPDRVQGLFKRCILVGAEFLVVEVLGPRGPDGEWLKVQVATFRREGEYTGGRWPGVVEPATPEEDARRRDCTINGMFLDPLTGRLDDHVGGKADLDARVLRAIGDPAARFDEDKLRVLRAVRMAARFELAIDPATLEAGRRMAGQIRVVSAERIAEELRKVLTHRHRARGFRLLREFNLVGPVLPELVPTFDLPYGPPAAPTGSLWDHTAAVLEALGGPTWPGVSFPLAFAAMLHDVGEPRTVGRTPDRYTFHGHEHVGARMAGEASRRLKLSNAETDRVVWLVQHHQYLADAPALRASRLKPILVHPGIGELLALHRADALASGKGLEHVEFCERVLRETPPEELNPPPVLTGDDLREAGLTPGPLFKRLLDAVREAQLEGKVRTKEDALRLVEELLRQWEAP
jgi:poly(A) polymerase